MNAAKKGSMSMGKDRSPCREEELTVGEFVSPLYEKISTLDSEAPDTYCSVETEPNISYQTVIPAAKDVKKANTTSRIAEKCDKEDVSYKRFICILVTITLVTLISLVCLAVLFIDVSQISQTPSSQNESVFIFQLEQINNSLTSIQDKITTLFREEMENNAAQSNNIQQLNTSTDMQLSTLHNQTQQLSDSNIMLQQQLTTLHNQTQQLSDSNTMLQQQLTTLHNQTQQLSDSNTATALRSVYFFPCSLLCCSSSLLPLRLLLGQWLTNTCVLYHVMWYTHWRVDESGISGHDKQQSPVSQWSHGAQ